MAQAREPEAAEPAPSTEAMEAALTLLDRSGPEYEGGLSNHGPMAAEALVVLERPGAVVPWVERYRRVLLADPAGRQRIDERDWRPALGDYARVGDWAAFFLRRLDEDGWRPVLARWCGHLAPGLSAAAFHGLIRTAHAARSLARRETPTRRRELARALAYWAARYEVLPEVGDGPPGRMLPSEAIGSVERLPESRKPRASILDQLPALEDLPSFRRVPDLVDTGGDPSRFLSDMAATFAGAYLRNAAPETTIALVHAVTGPSAVRLLIPYLPSDTIRRMLRYAWQAAAAIHASWAHDAPEDLPPAAPADRDDLIDRAVATGDEHAIKFVDACLREHAISPAPELLAAGRDAVARLRASP